MRPLLRTDRRHALLGLAGLPTLGFAAAPAAQRAALIVGFPEGSAHDVVAQALAPVAGRVLGVPASVEHRPGTSGRVAIEHVRAAPADGRTLLVTNAGMLVLGPLVFRDRPSDPVDRLQPVVLAARFDLALNVRPELPIGDLASLVDWARRFGARGEGVNVASHGAGTVSHVMIQALNHATGLRLSHLPYRGAVPARQALNEGQASLLFDTVGDSIGPVYSGRTRVLATTGASRSPFLATVPTVVEFGLPSLLASGWFGISASTAVASSIVTRLNAAFDAALAVPDVRERLFGAGLQAVGGSPQAFAQTIAADRQHWSRVLKTIGFSIDT